MAHFCFHYIYSIFLQKWSIKEPSSFFFFLIRGLFLWKEKLWAKFVQIHPLTWIFQAQQRTKDMMIWHYKVYTSSFFSYVVVNFILNYFYHHISRWNSWYAMLYLAWFSLFLFISIVVVIILIGHLWRFIFVGISMNKILILDKKAFY